jgi:ABC-type Mn2+/Zn2+ transport system ATPase subunit
MLVGVASATTAGGAVSTADKVLDDVFGVVGAQATTLIKTIMTMANAHNDLTRYSPDIQTFLRSNPAVAFLPQNNRAGSRVPPYASYGGMPYRPGLLSTV